MKTFKQFLEEQEISINAKIRKDIRDEIGQRASMMFDKSGKPYKQPEDRGFGKGDLPKSGKPSSVGNKHEYYKKKAGPGIDYSKLNKRLMNTNESKDPTPGKTPEKKTFVHAKKASYGTYTDDEYEAARKTPSNERGFQKRLRFGLPHSDDEVEQKMQNELPSRIFKKSEIFKDGGTERDLMNMKKLIRQHGGRIYKKDIKGPNGSTLKTGIFDPSEKPARKLFKIKSAPGTNIRNISDEPRMEKPETNYIPGTKKVRSVEL